MLKCSVDTIVKTVTTVLNSVLRSGKYPISWQKSMIVPLHKSGIKTELSNNRGLTISSCLSKVFNKILCKKLNQIMESKCKWNKFQNELPYRRQPIHS